MVTAKKLQDVLPGLGQVLRYFWPDVRRQRRLVASTFMALLAGIVFRLLEPWPLKFVIDRVVPSRRPAGVNRYPWLETIDARQLLVAAAVAVVLIALARALVDYTSKVGFFTIGNRVVIKVRDRLFRHIHQLSLSFHNSASSGDLVIRVTRDVSLLRDVAATAVLPLLASVMVLVGMLGVMFWLDWKLTLLAMVTVPLFWFTTLRIGRRIRSSARRQREREGAMAGIAAESIGAIEIVQSLSLQEAFAESFSQRNRASQKSDLKASRLSVRLGRTVDVILSVSTALVMFCGAELVLQSQMSPGDLLVFLVYIKRSFKPAQEFAKYTARLAKAAAAGERVVEVLERKSDVQDLATAVPAPRLQGHIRFADVSFAYGSGRPVLDHVDFELQPGRQLAIAGESGIGKTTLLRLVLRLYNPTEGQVLVDGRDVRQYAIDSLRSQISVVPQDSVLFSVSVRENIGYGRPGATPAEIEAAARLACAHEFIEALPDGYDTVLSERGASLSPGQRLRVAVARAAIRQAPIILLDEPTASLDEENRQAVVEALERLTEDRTTLLVTHDLSLAARADLILFLDQGRLVEFGTHEELVRSSGRYSAMYRLQSTGTFPGRGNGRASVM